MKNASDSCHTNIITGVAVTPDGRRAVSALWGNTLKVWDLERGTVVAEFYCEGSASACGYSNLYHSIIAGDGSGRNYILRLEGMR